MNNKSNCQISLDQAKLLVEHLEKGDNVKANEIISTINNPVNTKLLAEIGKLTRQLHDLLNNFYLNSRLKVLTLDDLPNTQKRLNYVITCTENAANKTLDAAEAIFPVMNDVQQKLDSVKPVLEQLIEKNEENDSKTLYFFHSINELIDIEQQSINTVNKLMTDILVAQDYQDLTGQIIRQVIDLIKEVENSLVNILTIFGVVIPEETDTSLTKRGGNLVEDPVVNTEKRTDFVKNQADVDDLLSNLDF